MPVYVTIIIVALLLTEILHWSFQHFVMPSREELSFFIDWSVLGIALGLLVLSIAVNYRLVKKLLYKL